ncbi:MAG: nucleotide exchange factor GrpE [Acidobacteria bacterium]|nr:nucleotide exchange factor GrpE [Acidobacteriota bacterium]
MADNRIPSYDLDDGRLDLDRSDAFDPNVKIPLSGPPQPQPVSESDKAAGAAVEALEELKRERDRLRDQLLRTAAEFDNYRKRIERERREHADRIVAELLQQFLTIVDDYERALRVDPAGDPEGYRKGVELIHRQFVELLRRCDVKPIEALGADFDPHLHQAVTQEHSPDHRDGEIIEELRRGYTIGGRLLRPAMVRVAKSS